MFREFQENNIFLKNVLSIYLEKFTHLFQSFEIQSFNSLQNLIHVNPWFDDGYK